MGNVTFTLDAESAKAVQGFLRVEDRQKALEQRSAQLAQRTGQHHDQAKRGSDDWSRALGGVASSYLSVGAAIGVSMKAFQAMRAEQEKAAADAKQAALGMGALAQLAGGSPQVLRELRFEAQRSMREEGMTSQEAGALQFALTSAGKGKLRQTYARLYGTADPMQMLNAVATLQGAMGVAETGGDRQILDKLFMASSGTKTTVQELAAAAAAAGPGGKRIGATDEETLAALAVLSRGTSSAAESATMLESLSTAALKKGLTTGGGFMEIVSQLRGKRMTASQMTKFLGRVEAGNAFQLLAENEASIAELTAQLQAADVAAAAGTGDVTGGIVASYRREYGAVRRARQVAREKEVLFENTYAKQELANQAELAEADILAQEYGGPVFGTGAYRFVQGAALRLKHAVGFGAPIDDLSMTVEVRDRRGGDAARMAQTE